jgi:hypothetical protein
MKEYIPIFLVSFVIGMVCVYFSPMEYKTVVVFPTPVNTKTIQYKDKAGQCFDFSARLVDCTSDAKKIPVQ